MTEQKIDVTKEEAGILAGRMQEMAAARAAAKEAERAFSDNFLMFLRGKKLPDGTQLLGVDPDEGWLRLKVPEATE